MSGWGAAPPIPQAAKRIVDDAIGSLCTAAVVRVERRGSIDTYAAGTLCPDPSAGPDRPCTATSLFDLASLTKLATTALVLSFVRERQLELDMPFRRPAGKRIVVGDHARAGRELGA